MPKEAPQEENFGSGHRLLRRIRARQESKRIKHMTEDTQEGVQRTLNSLPSSEDLPFCGDTSSDAAYSARLSPSWKK